MRMSRRASLWLTEENRRFLKAEQRRLEAEEGLVGLSLNQVLNYVVFLWRRHNDPAFKPLRIEDVEAQNATGYVYVITDGSGFFKIGSSRNPDERRKALQTGSASAITLLDVFECEASEMEAIERALHAKFKAKRTRGEWFSLDERDLEWIKQHSQLFATGAIQ